MTNKTVKCGYCNGTGKVPDNDAIGEEMKSLRKARGVSLAELGRTLKPSRTAGYLSDLEQGNRRWNQDLITKYQNALK